jgi:hypothetical protein
MLLYTYGNSNSGKGKERRARKYGVGSYVFAVESLRIDFIKDVGGKKYSSCIVHCYGVHIHYKKDNLYNYFAISRTHMLPV